MDTFGDAPLAGFVALLKAEGRRAVLGLDCGQGADGLAFVQEGIHYTGVDPSEAKVRAARARGLEVSVAEATALPFAAEAFPAVWAIDTLVGLPAGKHEDVIRELERVSRPGAPIAVVLSGSADITVLRSPGPDAA